jgi:hypothetical protein
VKTEDGNYELNNDDNIDYDQKYQLDNYIDQPVQEVVAEVLVDDETDRIIENLDELSFSSDKESIHNQIESYKLSLSRSIQNPIPMLPPSPPLPLSPPSLPSRPSMNKFSEDDLSELLHRIKARCSQIIAANQHLSAQQFKLLYSLYSPALASKITRNLRMNMGIQESVNNCSTDQLFYNYSHVLVHEINSYKKIMEMIQGVNSHKEMSDEELEDLILGLSQEI